MLSSCSTSHTDSKIVLVYLFRFLPDPRGAGHVEAFQFLSVCVCVCECVSVCSLNLFGLVRLGLRDLGIGGLGYNDG